MVPEEPQAKQVYTAYEPRAPDSGTLYGPWAVAHSMYPGASDGAGDDAAAASEGGSVADAAVASEAKASPVGSEGNGSNSSASMRSSSPARGTGKRGSMRHKLPVGCWSSPRLEPARPQDASTLRVHRTLPVICIEDRNR